MTLRGETTIQLYDAKSGDLVGEHHDTNMVTNAIRDIIGMNPWGFKDYINFTNHSDFRSVYPIVLNLMGGIVLFPTVLEENADKYFAPAKNIPTGYASSDTYTGADPKRGQYNKAESGPLVNGYKFVYDFPTDRGNGTIAAVSLTHADAGKRWQGSTYDTDSGYNANWWNELAADGGSYSTSFNAADNVLFGGWMNDVLYGASIPTSGSGTTPVTWKSIPYARGTVGLNTTIKPSTASTSTITLSADYRMTSNRNSVLCWDHDICHILATPGNSTGNVTIQHATITAGTMHEETLTIPAQIATGSTALLGVSDGILYAVDTDRAGIWRIELASSAATLLPLPTGMPKIRTGNYYGVQGYNPWSDRHLAVKAYGDDNNNHGILICDDTIISISDSDAKYYSGVVGTEAVESTLCGNVGPYMLNDNMPSGSNHYLQLLMRTTYLATINNLTAAVTKTAAQTMKITYTITEA